MQQVINFKLSTKLCQKIEEICKASNKSMDQVLKEAVELLIEEREDYYSALERLKQKNPYIPFEEVRAG